MSFSGSSWAKILNAMAKTSGKELAISAAPILLAIPGVFDEMLAGVAAVGLVAVFLFLRWQVNNRADFIEATLRDAGEKQLLTHDETVEAIAQLHELSMSR